jgi:UDP-N-acetylmuramate-alanine ligase
VKHLCKEFARAFDDAHEVVLTDITAPAKKIRKNVGVVIDLPGSD